MSILDLLMEKKDIYIYIDCRIAYLEYRKLIEIKHQKPKKRELINERFNGRIRELKLLKKLIKSGLMKYESKKLWKYRKKDGSLGHMWNFKRYQDKYPYAGESEFYSPNEEFDEKKINKSKK